MRTLRGQKQKLNPLKYIEPKGKIISWFIIYIFAKLLIFFILDSQYLTQALQGRCSVN